VTETVSAVVLRAILVGSGRLGADPHALAREAGIPAKVFSDDSTSYPLVRLGRVWQLASWRLADPQVGLHVASEWWLGMYGVTDYLLDSAATLADGMSLAVEFMPILGSRKTDDVGFSRADGHGVLRFDIPTPDPAVNAAAAEFCLTTMLTRARQATGQPVTPVQVEIAAPAPSSHGELCEAWGTRRIEFGAARSAMTFRRADLGLPLLRADPVLAQIVHDRATAEITALEHPIRWIDMCRQVVINCLDDRDALLASAARRLAVSPRTLQRLLEREGTSWRAEVDAARRERAAQLLTGGMSKFSVARRLGYTDPRALRRATRRWSSP
jgi:AraC-like DNA-binding protein